MKRPFLLFLPFLLFIAGAFVACEEVEEAGKYDNWVPRNEAFIDSIKGKTGDNIVASLEDAEKMEIGTLYAISRADQRYRGQWYFTSSVCVLQEVVENR